jgi:hypothetical protein
VQWYRYALALHSGETRFVEPLEPGRADGRRFRVTRDSRGRITRVATFVGSSRVAEVAYRYRGVSRWARGYEYRAADGELTTVVEIHRDEQGRRVNQEFFLVGGGLTHYSLRWYRGVDVNHVHYGLDGKAEHRSALSYSNEDVLVRARWNPAATSALYQAQARTTTVYDSEFDERTGLRRERRKFRDGALVSTSRTTHDAGGLPIQASHHDAAGRRYGVTDYAGGLKVRSRLEPGPGTTLDLTFLYDAKRWTRETRYAHNGRDVCVLAYERLANGRVVRSIARGPDGEVWAEYPDLYVEYIEPSGEAVDRPGVAKIFRKGPWWPWPGELITHVDGL